MDQTREHLKLLAIGNYVLGAITYLISLFPIFHLIIGIWMMAMPADQWESDSETSAELVDSPPAASARESDADGKVSERTGAESPFETILMMRFMGGAFAFIAAAIILFGFAFSTVMIVAGRRMSRGRSYHLCFAVAVLQCASFLPLHLALGVLTILVLVKPQAKVIFGIPEAYGERDHG